LTEIGVVVNPNDPVIASIIARCAEILNGYFQTEALQIEKYTWRSRDDSRVRTSHSEYDDRVFSWSDPPEGGHPGRGWNCRCTAEPIIDQASIPEAAVCDILTGDRLASVFPDADTDRLAQIAREIDASIVTARLDSPDRLTHFFGQVRQEVGQELRLAESLDYRADRLAPIFSYFRRYPEDALLYERTADQPADQEAIASRARANRIGSDGIESGDGWRLRARGAEAGQGTGELPGLHRRSCGIVWWSDRL
jgi:hypothetical protein